MECELFLEILMGSMVDLYPSGHFGQGIKRLAMCEAA